MGSGVTTIDTKVVAAETEWEKGVCLCKQETRVDVYRGLFQNHHHFIIGYYPRLRRSIMTVVLQKEGKVDYLIPESYRPIALENTLSKILEKVIADYIVDTVEKYALLLQSQIGARKNRLTLLALILLATTIKTAWAIRKDFIVLMLSLDISGAYNNIPYKRLLYILRAKGFLEWII